ncbi:hypothetical protein AGMMS49545_00530 [Betaproteobacteria bacterium]|nr:hypothetical protein AGMMS49545_00530 [Betaproteobacteria bacterium]GHU40715.1 hypothetical protein AGMMS50289_02700 [Betaproteobacteria bacterium]
MKRARPTKLDFGVQGYDGKRGIGFNVRQERFTNRPWVWLRAENLKTAFDTTSAPRRVSNPPLFSALCLLFPAPP